MKSCKRSIGWPVSGGTSSSGSPSAGAGATRLAVTGGTPASAVLSWHAPAGTVGFDVLRGPERIGPVPVGGWQA